MQAYPTQLSIKQNISFHKNICYFELFSEQSTIINCNIMGWINSVAKCYVFREVRLRRLNIIQNHNTRHRVKPWHHLHC
jgi:hypothetical protein